MGRAGDERRSKYVRGILPSCCQPADSEVGTRLAPKANTWPQRVCRHRAGPGQAMSVPVPPAAPLTAM
ncbi:hypothetical protein LUU34_00305300 [Aix galericulata]|nr:hypothetical protein LUU34_00305300 [Aix galericulata]